MKMGPIGCAETSVSNQISILRNIPEERRSQPDSCSLVKIDSPLLSSSLYFTECTHKVYFQIRFSIAHIRLCLKCDGTCAETRFRLSAKRTSPFKSASESVPSTTGSQGVRISGSNAGYNILRGGVKGTGYALYSPVSSSLPVPCVTVCHHISTGLYLPLSPTRPCVA